MSAKEQLYNQSVIADNEVMKLRLLFLRYDENLSKEEKRRITMHIDSIITHSANLKEDLK